jgi:4-amino-4-deoxy-L-arabinose transferase-like glycosyltransferase
MHMVPGDIWLFSISVALALAAIITFSLGKKNAALVLLAGSAFFIRLYMAHMDAFLHDWDEKYHALVARNMMDNPFKPVLKNGLNIPYDYKAWCCNYIWVHKQPLFMWQMALSMKIFGISECAIRYPDVLMGTLMVLMVYRIGKLLSSNDAIGFIAAMLLCFSNYQLELLSGFHGMDHNDHAFGFYVLASIWAYVEYIKTGKFKWVIWIGVFAGCAVLNKWLTGLLVFAAWAGNILLHIRSNATRKEILHLLAALAICIALFLPWQLYILYDFPQESSYELGYNSKHLFEVVEGHKGSAWYYMDIMPMYSHSLLWELAIWGIVCTMLFKEYRNKYGIALIIAIVVAYCFFSFMVASKLQSYMFVVAPFMFIMIAIVVGTVFKQVKLPVFDQLVIAAYFCVLVLDMDGIKTKHNPDDGYRQAKAHNTAIYKTLKDELPADVKVVTNLPEFADVECMFYTKGVTAYHYNPSETEYAILKQTGLRIAAFEDHMGYNIPAHIKNDTSVYIIHKALK